MADRTLYYPKRCSTCSPIFKRNQGTRIPHPKGTDHPKWTGGRQINPVTGYVTIMVKRGDRMVRMYEHRYVWETHHGPIPPRLHVHHINHVKTDNRIENLTLITPHGHNTLHFKISRWAIEHDACVQCGTVDIPHNGHGLCERCAGLAYRKQKWLDGRAQARRKYAPDAWARQYNACVTCEQTDRKHVGRGLCQRCYYRWWEANRRR